MKENNMMRQINSVFSAFMVMFYLGAGTLLVFFLENSPIDKAMRVIIGSAFLIFGVFRAFRLFFMIKEAFFNTDSDNE
jgi:hypothetical protein